MIAVLHRSGRLPRAPRLTTLSRWHWQALADGILQTTRCVNCQRLRFPPRPSCPKCWGQDWCWEELPDQGTLYSRSRIHVVPERFIDISPLDVGVIDLVAGPRLICWLAEGAELLPLDSPVEMVALRYEDGAILGARPAAKA